LVNLHLMQTGSFAVGLVSCINGSVVSILLQLLYEVVLLLKHLSSRALFEYIYIYLNGFVRELYSVFVL
jgi:hypothetical protein